jgi:hypothetical protein
VLSLVLIISKSEKVSTHEVGKFNHSLFEMSDVGRGIADKLVFNAFGQYPGFMIVAARNAVRNVSQVSLNNREIVRERLSAHEHEIFLVDIRVVAKPGVRLIEGKSSKVPPSCFCVRRIIPRIEILLIGERRIRGHNATSQSGQRRAVDN